MKHSKQESSQAFVITRHEAEQINLLEAFGDTYFCLNCGCQVAANHSHDNEQEEGENVAA